MGKAPKPGPDGFWDEEEVLEAKRRCGKKGPGRKPGSIITGGVRPGREWRSEKKAKTGRASPDGSGGEQKAKEEEFEGLDPDTKFRTIKAEQEELKLNVMRGNLLDAKVMERRLFRVHALIKDRISALPAKAAPFIAARTVLVEGRLDEGSLYRALRDAVQGLFKEIAEIDLQKELGVDPDVIDDRELEESDTEQPMRGSK